MADIIIPWDGAHASIPANWTRYTALDGRYPKAANASLAGTGGSSTHTHTGSSHTHTYTSNSHTHATGNIDNASAATKSDAQHQDEPEHDVSSGDHYHDGGASGAFTSASISTDGFTTGTGANEYSRYHFIFIKGLVTLPLPSSAVVMRDDTDSRSGSSHFDAANGKYMKGAATSADSGSAATVTTHTHTQTHDHDLSHTHANITSSGNYGMIGGKDIGSSSPGNHTHTISFTAATESPNNATAVSAGTGTLKYRELHFWKTSSQATAQVGDIVMTIEASVPSGWTDLEYNDRYIIGKSEGGALGTGGAHTHTHANLSHTHVGTSHTHVWTGSNTSGSNAYRNGGSSGLNESHTHGGTTAAATNSTTGSAAATFTTDNDEPLYVNIKYIQKTSGDSGASFLLMFT